MKSGAAKTEITLDFLFHSLVHVLKIYMYPFLKKVNFNQGSKENPTLEFKWQNESILISSQTDGI